MQEKINYYELDPEKKRKILEQIREELRKIDEVLVAIAYGSFTRRRFFRDLDLALYTGGTVQDQLAFEALLAHKLSKKIGVKVDARVIDDAPPWFKVKVLNEGTLVYEKSRGAYALFAKEAIGEKQDIELKTKIAKKRLYHSENET